MIKQSLYSKLDIIKEACRKNLEVQAHALLIMFTTQYL